MRSLSPRQREWLRLSREGVSSRLLLGQLEGQLRDDIALGTLQKAWQTITAQHPELRVQFHWNGAPEPAVNIAPAVLTPWRQLDWSELSETEQQRRRRQWLETEQQTGIELSQAPLFRLTACRLGPRGLWLVWSFHRALLEPGAALEIARELFAVCRQQARSHSPPDPSRDRANPPARQDHPLESTPLGLPRPPATAPQDPVTAGWARECCQSQLGTATTRVLQQLCDRQSISWPVLLAGLWAALLGRYSDRQRVVFSLETEGQARTVAVNLAEDLSALAWLRQLPAQLLDQETERATWETALVCQEHPARLKLTSPLAQWQWQWRAVPVEPVCLRVDSAPRGRLIAEFDPQRFRPESIERLLGHFCTLCQGLAQAPEKRLADLELLTPAEREQMLGQWNQTSAPYPLERTYPELFAEQVQQSPQAVALRCGDAELTYAALDEWSSQLAAHLQTLGIGPDQPVGVCLERSLELPVTLLAVLKAGGAYLPLDPTYPPERLAAMLEDAEPPVLVTRRGLGQSLPLSAQQTVYLDDWHPGQNPPAQPPRTGPENLAYLMYTSGSTGSPKGVAIPQRALVNHNCAVRQAYQLGPADRVLQFATPNFDLSVEEIFPTWLAGAMLVLRPPDLLDSVERFMGFVQREQISVLNLPTAYWHELCRGLDQHPLPAGVRLVVIGGEAASLEAYRAWQSSGVALINTYGPTETTVTATLFRATAALELPIGRPLPNVRTHVLDRLRRPVPVGVTGELYIGGAGLAHGYWRRPEQTAQRFVPNPFLEGTKLYRTGDLVRYRSDGNLEFVGRTDNQVKWRGYRVELGEIEAVLSQQPGVREAIVLVRDQKLVAYYLGHSSSQELAAGLRRRLPDYMIPTHWVALAQWPLSPGGKIDRRSLPAPASEQLQSSVVDELAQRLAKLWAEALELDQVGLDQNFFELGGHSLRAMRLVTLIEQNLGQHLTAADIYQAGNVAALTQRLQLPPAERLANSLVEIQGRGSLPALYFVHGIGGGLFWGYSNIARHLPDQPVYVFKSRGLDGWPEHEQIEAMAAAYVADLQAFQPRGPYQLAGYCFGGTVAYEMARQLQNAGQTVSLLALMNCPPTNTDYLNAPPSPLVLARFLGNLLYRAGRMARWSHAQRREFVRWKWQQWQQRRHLDSAAAQEQLGREDMFDQAAYTPAQHHLWNVHARAYQAYQTRPYYGPVWLLRSRGHPFWCSFDRYYGWRPWIKGPLTLRLLPGAHETILREPQVKVLADCLRQALSLSRENWR